MLRNDFQSSHWWHKENANKKTITLIGSKCCFVVFLNRNKLFPLRIHCFLRGENNLPSNFATSPL